MTNQEQFNTNPTYSYHSAVRMSQRGISPEAIKACIHHGEVIYKQGIRFYFIPKKYLHTLPIKLQDKVKDLVVVTDLNGQYVITCYRNSDALHKVKKKPKRLATGRE
jgi:hypothetical protein